MTPGQRADRAWTNINIASGALGKMVVKKDLRVGGIRVVIAALERAEADLREILGEKK